MLIFTYQYHTNLTFNQQFLQHVSAQQTPTGYHKVTDVYSCTGDRLKVAQALFAWDSNGLIEWKDQTAQEFRFTTTTYTALNTI